MTKLVTMIALLMMSTLVVTSPASAQDVDCDAIAAYLDEVDTTITAEVHALVTGPGWADDVRGVLGIVNAGGSPTEDVSGEDIAPLMDLFSVPRDVLSAMEPSAVPDDARALHDSAIGFWETMPLLIMAELNSDDDAMDAALNDLVSFAPANAQAQQTIGTACPGLIEAELENMDVIGALFDTLDSGSATPVAMANATIADLDGVGVYFLIMPGGIGPGLAGPGPVATPVREPARVTAPGPRSTPASTPGS